MSKIEDAIKSLNKKFKSEVIGGKDINSFKGRGEIPWESPALTWLFRGGLRTQTLGEVYGQYSSGKTTLCYSILGQAQKYFKARYHNELEELQSKEKLNGTEKTRLAELLDMGEPRYVYLDSENSADVKWMAKNRADPDDVIFIKPQQESAEELLQALIDLIETNSVRLVIIDSLATLVSSSAMEKSIEQKTYAGISGCLTVFVNKLMPMLSKYDCTVVCINQERDVLNSMVPGQKNTPGGRAVKFNAHYRIALRKGRCLDEKYNEIPNNTETMFGQTTEIQVTKNKLTPYDRKLAKVSITFENGIDKYNDVFLMSVSLGIMNQAGAWYSMLDDAGEVITDTEGNLMKWQGKPNVMAYLKAHEDFTQSLIKKIEELTK